VESTDIRMPDSTPEDSSEEAAVLAEPGPTLGVVVIFSETLESEVNESDPRLGRVYPLREGEILFIGRHHVPADVPRSTGENIPPTHSHLFPHGGLYGYISRQHLTVEMDARGGTILTDYSRHGVYLVKAEKWHRRKDGDGPPESHRLTGDEVVVLMDDLGEPAKGDLADRRSRYSLHIIHPTSVADGDSRTETHS
jgi:hypothetical protein